MLRRVAPLLVLSCATPSPHSAPNGGQEIAYEISVETDGDRLQIEATVPAGLGTSLHVDDVAIRFVHDAQENHDGAWHDLALDHERFLLPGCAQGCQVRWSYDLAAAATALDDRDYAQRFERAIVAPPGTYLLRPVDMPAGASIRFHASVPEGTAFTTGVAPDPHRW